MSSYIAFLLAALVLALTPGPGIAYVVARTAAGGRTEGLASCIGTAIGGMFHVAAAAVGLSLLLVESAVAFSVVKYVGAAYLAYLGLRLLLSKQVSSQSAQGPALGSRKALREGVLVEALNVKTALFFLAFLPQFVVPGPPVVLQLVVMGVICVALNTLVDVLAVLGASRILGSERARRKRERLLTQASGATMVGLGLYVALSRRGT
jgi:threonine/homoserine/homoserine lactone efflux protein